VPSINHHGLVLRIDDLGTEDAAQWASRVVTMGARRASISRTRHGLQLTTEFAPTNGGGTLDLARLLLLACEVEGVDIEQVLATAKNRAA
jgi:hypothetical protein